MRLFAVFFLLEGILIVATGFVLYLDNLNFEILLNTEFCMSHQYSNHIKNLYWLHTSNLDNMGCSFVTSLNLLHIEG